MATIPASDNEFPKVLLTEGAAPAAPAANLVEIYAKADGLPYTKDDAGAESPMTPNAHIADTTAAHAASAVSVDPTGLSVVAGTDVQTAIEELDAGIAGGGIPVTIFDAQGDIIVASAADTAARLALGASATVLRSNGTTAAWALPPGHEFDYAEITSSQGVSATAEASATTVITGNAVTYDGSTVVLVEFYAPAVVASTGASTDNIVVVLYDGSSSIGRLQLGSAVVTTASQAKYPGSGKRRLTPSAGSHTYSIRAFCTSASGGAVQAGAGGSGNSMPAFMRITKV